MYVFRHFRGVRGAGLYIPSELDFVQRSCC